jgi:hypothetical protein
MNKRKATFLLLALLWGLSAVAQQMPEQPLTLWYVYTVRPGQEAEFMKLVNAVGAPVRDKLMTEGAVIGWGIDTPILRNPEGSTHWIWVSIPNWAALEKVNKAMAAQFAKIAADDAAAAEDARKRNRPAGKDFTQRVNEIVDTSKTRDYLTRDLVFGGATTPPPAGTLPITRYNFAKVHAGMAGNYREAWEKYSKPVYDKLVSEGVVLGYGLSVEELKTDDDFTHFIWVVVKNLGDFDKVRDAFRADRGRRSQEERDSISATFGGMTDADAARNYVTNAVVFKLVGQQ